jgi:LysM repeat protein
MYTNLAFAQDCSGGYGPGCPPPEETYPTPRTGGWLLFPPPPPTLVERTKIFYYCNIDARQLEKINALLHNWTLAQYAKIDKDYALWTYLWTSDGYYNLTIRNEKKGEINLQVAQYMQKKGFNSKLGVATNYQTRGQCLKANNASPYDECIVDNSTCKYGEDVAPVAEEVLEKTLCVKREFESVPDANTMSSYNLCSNDGIFTQLTSSTQWNIYSFYGFCKNSSSIDTDKDRCTYQAYSEKTKIPIEILHIDGVVRDYDALEIPGIEVMLTKSSGEVLTTITDKNGKYKFNKLLAWIYLVQPVNKKPFLFPKIESADLTKWSVSLDFYALDVADDIKDDENIDDLIDTRNQISEEVENIIENAKILDSISVLNSSPLNNLSNILSPVSSNAIGIIQSLTADKKKRKYVEKVSICGDELVQDDEVCDDWINNGKDGYCSSDCQYTGEVKLLSADNDVIELINIEDISLLSQSVSEGIDWIKDLINKAGDFIENSQNYFKQKIGENLSPKLQEGIKKTLEVAEDIAKYWAVTIASILWAVGTALQIMIHKARWLSYVVQEGDTLESIGNNFTMTNRAIKNMNGIGKWWKLTPGTKMKLRNRKFLEKDYLDQLKTVLQDTLKKRNYWKMSEKIEKMFAKK